MRRRSLKGSRGIAWAAFLVVPATAPAYTNVTATEVHDRIVAGDDIVLLDVREYTEFCSAAKHIENAACLPWNSGVLRTDYTKLPTTKDIIVYCAAGSRSPAASTYLEGQGFTRVFNMLGGMNGWTYEREACETNPPGPLLFVEPTATGATIDWRPTTGTQNYDLLRGRLDQITSDATTVNLGTTDCLGRVTPFTCIPDDTLPGAGQAFFYLARQTGGDYGTSFPDGLPRVAPPPACD